jgi:Domain of unknown function (DUF4136)
MSSTINRIVNVILAALLMWFLPVSRSLALDVQTAFDPKFPLSQLKSFSFAKQDRKSPDGLVNNPRAENMIRENLELEFSAIGMEKVSAEADFLFAFYAKSVLRTRWQTPSGGGPVSSGNASPDGYEVGTLVVDIVDRKSSQVVWRGIATKTLSPNQDKANQAVREACMKLAKKFKKNAEKQTK